MTEKTLVPVPKSEERRAAARKARLEKRQRAGQQKGRAAAKVEGGSEPTVARQGGHAPATMDASAFVLPPRAELTKTASNFGRLVKTLFVIGVLLPTVLAAAFYAFAASDQYATTSAFAVRGASSTSSPVDIEGLFGLGGTSLGSEAADSYIVQEYIQSREMVEILIAESNFIDVYTRPSADPYYRLDESGTIEDFVDYWNMMNNVEYDTDTGIMQMTTRAFRPEDAQAITAKVIEKSEALVNDLSMRSREDSVQAARRELDLAERAFADARKELAGYRGSEREIDPTATATARATVVAELEGELARLEAQLSALRATMSENAPRVNVVRDQINAVRAQILAERESVAVAEDGATQPVLTERLSRYEELVAEREFAEKRFISALSALEAARIEALKQQRYLAVFVRGAAPEEAGYPEGLRWTAILFGALFLGWGVLSLILAAVRDRIS